MEATSNSKQRKLVGVTKTRTGKYMARAYGNHLGTFNTPMEAARHYDKIAFELKGEAANLNCPQEYGQKPKLHNFIGVRKYDNQFHAEIENKNSVGFIGVFDTAEEAARAYDKEATKLWGPLADLNFP